MKFWLLYSITGFSFGMAVQNEIARNCPDTVPRAVYAVFFGTTWPLTLPILAVQDVCGGEDKPVKGEDQ